MTFKTTTRRRAPRRGAIVRTAREAQHHATVRPWDRPTRRQMEALDALAEHAIAEYEAGRTISLQDYAAKHGITFGDDAGSSGSNARDS